ncbi:MAG TPA: hypothetical protein PK796_01865 [Bacteroidales bacterium]|jgi:hypothetical protein|nr:hypothetical protein [Bacteroidales bacterium]
MKNVTLIAGLLLAALIFFAGCKKEETVVTITTTAITSITATTATGGGTITVTGPGTVTDRGVCWSTAATPTTADSKTSDGTGTGTFTSSITGLSMKTPYYVRAYAIVDGTTYYATAVDFTSATPAPVELIVNGDFSTPGVNGELVTATPWKTDETTDVNDPIGSLDLIGYTSDTYKGQTNFAWYHDWSKSFYQTVGTVPAIETKFDISFKNTCTWNDWGDYVQQTGVIFSVYTGTDPTTRTAIDTVIFDEPVFPGWDLNVWTSKTGTYTLTAEKAAANAGKNLVIEFDTFHYWDGTWASSAWYDIDDISVIQRFE